MQPPFVRSPRPIPSNPCPLSRRRPPRPPRARPTRIATSRARPRRTARRSRPRWSWSRTGCRSTSRSCRTAAPAPGSRPAAWSPRSRPILSRRHGAWIGWPGIAGRARSSRPRPTGSAWSRSRCQPKTSRASTRASPTSTLWPLYHDAVADSQFHRDWWEAYQRVNERFAEAAADIAAPGATVWVHDYQLQLVPQAAAPAATRRADRLLPAHPVPAGRAVHAAAVADPDHRRPARRRPDRLPAARRRAQLHPAGQVADRRRRPPAGSIELRRPDRSTPAAFPISIDSAEQSALAATPRGARGRPAAPRGSRRTAARSSWASTGSTTPRASTSGCGRSASCSPRTTPPCRTR